MPDIVKVITFDISLWTTSNRTDLIVCFAVHMLDINECRQFQIDCGQDRTCFNTRGAYECLDVPCPVDYTRVNLTDCQLECVEPSTTCSHRRAHHIRHRFVALSRLTPSNRIVFRLSSIDNNVNSTLIVLIDRNHLNNTLPFTLHGFNLITSQLLIDANEYEFELQLYSIERRTKNAAAVERRRRRRRRRHRLYTTYLVRIHVSPFHF
jgi:hypothetical protein